MPRVPNIDDIPAVQIDMGGRPRNVRLVETRFVAPGFDDQGRKYYVVEDPRPIKAWRRILFKSYRAAQKRYGRVVPEKLRDLHWSLKRPMLVRLEVR